MRLSSARGGWSARDVLRTIVPAVDQPSTEGRFGARLRESEEASRPRLQTLPALVRDKQDCKTFTVGILTPIKHCATITFGRKFGTASDPFMGFVAVQSSRSSTEKLISSRVEEIHKTSREPNGRTREEGSDDRGNPRRGSRTNSGAAFLSSR